MDRSVHGEATAKIYRNILLHPTFTVEELCADTSLRADQVYPILAKLRQRKVLSVKTVGHTKKRSPHRPTQRYVLSEDGDTRKALANKIRPFLQLSPESLSSSPALTKVEDLLANLKERLASIPVMLELVANDQLHVWESGVNQIQHELRDLKDDLEIAWYECNRSPKVYCQRELEVAESTFDQLYKSSEELHQRIRARLAELKAELDFSNITKSLFNKEPETNDALAFRVLENAYNANNSVYLNRILSSVVARLRFARDGRHLCFTDQAIAYALAEVSIRFGGDPRLFVNWIIRIPGLSNSEEERTIIRYNLANAYLLVMGSESVGFDYWKEMIVSPHAFDVIQGNINQLFVYGGTVLMSGDLGGLETQRLQEVQQTLGVHGSFSIVSTTPVEVLGIEPYVLKPTLMDWFKHDSGFPLSATLRAQRDDLYAYGPLADVIQFPGLPRVRLATALVRLGAKVERAWSIAETLKVGKVVLALHTQAAADNKLGGELQASLPGFVFEGTFATNRTSDDTAERPAAAAAAGAGF